MRPAAFPLRLGGVGAMGTTGTYHLPKLPAHREDPVPTPGGIPKRSLKHAVFRPLNTVPTQMPGQRRILVAGEAELLSKPARMAGASSALVDRRQYATSHHVASLPW